MLVSKSWLSQFVSINVSTEKLCEHLTALGLEVEGVDRAAPDFKQVVVGKVAQLEQHPDADKLKVATVDVNGDEPLQIVCGAKNIKEGMLVPVAMIGAVLPGDFKIKKSKLRGVVSFGMICSASELGLEESSAGIMSLPSDTVVGKDIREVLDLDDEIIEIGLTPNRGDCASILGVAKEIGVALGSAVQPVEAEMLTEKNAEKININLSAPSACPAYYACKISGIDNSQPSPFWLSEKLRRVGLRSLSPLVDITNLIMIELGIPMHAFDASTIDGGITVRLANANEKLNLLDGKSIELSDDMLVIADDSKSLALAGIMGGESSAVNEKTQSVLLEAAWFNPKSIAGKARRLGLHTDSSYRFERGVDFDLQQKAISRAAQLVIELCGGEIEVVSQAVSTENLPKRQSILLDNSIVNQRLGVSIKTSEIASILSSLDMQVETEENEKVLEVTPPTRRFDINIIEDLIEEVARVWGYDNIPIAEIRYQNTISNSAAKVLEKRSVGKLLNHLGYDEVITYSFIDKESAGLFADKAAFIELLNPISKELSVMRSVVLPSLVKILAYNANRQQANIRIYEVGNAYCQSVNASSGVDCLEQIAGIASGLKYPAQWGYKGHQIDFFDVKGDLEMLFEKMGVLDQITFKKSDRPYLHPGQSADILYRGEVLGYLGAVHPRIVKHFDLPYKAIAFEFDSGLISQPQIKTAEKVSKYPEVKRDLSVLLAQSHASGEILNSIRSIDKKLIKSVQLFDVYVGRNIPKNTKSMAISVYIQDSEKTLKDEQVDQLIEKIVAQLETQFNAKLRG